MARDFKRTDRVAEVIQQELAQIIQQQLNDPRVGLVTVSGVKVSRDLAHAKVLVSVMQEETAKETIKALNHAAGFFRAILSKRIQMRVMPALNFVYDDSFIKANRLTKLIDKAVAFDKTEAEDNNSSDSE